MTKKNVNPWNYGLLMVLLLLANCAAGICATRAPSLSVNQQGDAVTLDWSNIQEADSYTLYYAPYPGADYLGEAELGDTNTATFTLWPGAAFYVAVRARGASGQSDYSNIEHFTIVSESSGDDLSDSGGDVPSSLTFPIVDTGQNNCYDSAGKMVNCPEEGGVTAGQDAQFNGFSPSYTNNGNGTVTDNVTGLMWQQDPGEKMTWDQAVAGAGSLTLGGYNDWRLPTIKELYSLIKFNGIDPSGVSGNDTSGLVPFIDTDYFVFEYGDTSNGERIIDSQFTTSTKYVHTTMNGAETVFGVNFADGRIKGYGTGMNGNAKTFFTLYVRGNTAYGINNFVDNGDGTVTDNATGLTWMQKDSGHLSAGDSGDGKLNWEQALAWAEGLTYAGKSDWRVPNVKELQSMVDYTRSPATTASAAIDPVFDVTVISDEGGGINYPFYWSSTTHVNERTGANAAYVAFGEALGFMSFNGGSYELMDVHGAGAQRSDPKMGDPADYPTGHGPQGDVIRIYNFVRCVRGGQ